MDNSGKLLSVQKEPFYLALLVQIFQPPALDLLWIASKQMIKNQYSRHRLFYSMHSLSFSKPAAIKLNPVFTATEAQGLFTSIMATRGGYFT